MTELAIRVAAAATLIWLGMVLAISFLEAPLKFRAEGLELRVGLAIGRIVFRALNIAEVIWAVVIAVCLTIAGASGPVLVLAAVTAVLLAVQLLLVRPRLNRRSARVLAGHGDHLVIPSTRHGLHAVDDCVVLLTVAKSVQR